MSQPGLPPAPSHADINAALNMVMRTESSLFPRSLRVRKAFYAARRVVGMVQATSGLEGQAVDKATLREMIRRTVRELLAKKGKAR